MLVRVNVGKVYLEPRVKFREADGVAEFYYSYNDKIKLGVMRNDGQITGWAMEVEGDVYVLNPRVLLKMLEKML